MHNSIYEDLISFHGHSCPGLAIGYRMARAGMDFLVGSRSVDEELVAIVENNACGVDALQFLTGCTFGKGNFIYKDYGKQVFTLYDRKSRKGVRIALNLQNMPDDIGKDKDRFISWLLSAPEEDIVSIREVNIDEPEPARIMQSVNCDFCGEGVMESRTRKVGDKTACIPCAGPGL